MRPSFNLIDQAWIPCVTVEGDLIEVSLRDLLLRAPQLREIACATPIQSAAVMPLALTVLHRVFGPASLAEWKALWDARAFDMAPIDAYFALRHERFDLFHPERPFYQALDERVKPKSLIHLVHSKGNTGTLFTHETDEDGMEASPAEAARLLITSRLFRTCGTGPFIDGKRVQFRDSPFTRGVICWAQGSTLYDTLRLNLMLRAGEHPLPNSDKDAPAWEMDDPFAVRSRPLGYLDYLTWSNNRIQLIPCSNGVSPTVREATVGFAQQLDEKVKSPQKCYIANEKHGNVTGDRLDFNEQKALWRDYRSFPLQTHKEDYPPSVIVAWLSTLVQFRLLPRDYPLRLMATGMLANKAAVIFYREEILPLPLEILRDAEHIADIGDALKQAEDIAGALDKALNTLARHILLRGASGKTSKIDREGLIQNWRARERYWSELESSFRPFLNDLISDSDKALSDWTIALRKAALGALATASRRAGSRAPALKGSVAETQAIVRFLADAHATSEEPDIQSFCNKQRRALKDETEALDIALFGRMLAGRPELNIEAACQVAHAISTHEVTIPQSDFYTAVDDLLPAETRGAAMMDDTYFNSATYYSHIRIHWEQLVANCGGKIDLARRGVKAPMLAFALVVPSGKKNSFVNQHRPDLLIAVARPNNDGQSLANAFEQPLRASNGKGYVEPSILALSNCWDQTEICYRLERPISLC